jgi:hypothetical protein
METSYDAFDDCPSFIGEEMDFVDDEKAACRA